LAVGLSIAQIISWGSIFYGFSVLLGPIEQEMHWGRDAIVGAFSLSVLVTGLGAAPVGVMLDRYGGRRVMALGSIGAALIFLLMSQVQSIAAFYVAWAALGCAAAMLLYEPAFAVIYEVYGANARNALTALTLMAGFASTIFWPLTNTLVGVLGWRNTLVALGAMNFLVCFPLHALAIPRRDITGKTKPSKTIPLPSHHPKEILRLRAFWLLALSFIANIFAFACLSVHLIPLLQEKGFAAQTAVWLAALVGPMQVLGRLVD
jgi:MFS family permease